MEHLKYGFFKETLSKRLYEFLLTKQYTDCTFEVVNFSTGQHEEICAHKLVLATASPVFEAFFYGNFKIPDKIQVSDVDASTFKIMLNYIYTGCEEVDYSANGCNLFYAAKKYLLPELADIAKLRTIRSLSETSCWEAYRIGELYEDQDLMDESFRFITLFIGKTFKHAGDFLNEKLLLKLLNVDYYGHDHVTHKLICKLCYQWASYQCEKKNIECCAKNIQDVLTENGLFKRLRWSMDSLECDADMTKMGQFISSNSFCRLYVNRYPLRNFYFPRYSVDTNRQLNKRPNFIWEKTIKSSTFISVNKLAFLKGFYMKFYMDKVQVIFSDLNSQQAFMAVSSSNSNGQFFYSLDKGFHLNAMKRHEIEITFQINEALLSELAKLYSGFPFNKKNLSPKSGLCVEYHFESFAGFNGLSAVSGVLLAN